MIAIDTNLLVRLVAEPNSAQGSRARTFLLEQLSSAHPGYVASLVTAELIWVLEDIYDVSRDQIVAQLAALLNAAELVFEHHDAIERALTLPHRDLADCILHEIGLAAGCSHTATFDKRFAKLDRVELVK